ncbi:MAG: Hint domain-containing protein [Candidatus Omnitrophica bacterium]|nr:Hint domain-containing protein [Candidatus Omnitrophota bacterium]
MISRSLNRGVGLIEVLISSLLILLAVGETTYTFLAGEKKIAETGHRIEAVNFSQATLENLTAKGFDSAELAQQNNRPQELPDGSNLKEHFQGDRIYTVEDIPDEVTKQPAYKKITAITSWTAGGKPDHVTLVTLLSNPAAYIRVVPGSVHTVCDKSCQCVEIEGAGANECVLGTNCCEGPPTGRCDVNNKCSPEGTGAACSSNEYCAALPLTRCDSNNKCSLAGVGAPCGSVDANCSGIKHCQGDQCVVGGGGIECSENTNCVLPAPTVTLVASPPVINKGGFSILTWVSTNGKTAYIDGIGSVNLNGFLSVSPETTTTYTITVTGPGGTATASAIVKVAPTVILTASPPVINKGGSSILSWISANANTAVIDNGIGSVYVNGSIPISPATTTTYTITVTGPGGTATATATVTVNRPKRCTTGNRCSLTGTGDECNNDADCAGSVKKCKGSRCVAGGTGIECSSNNDCGAPPPTCEELGTCPPSPPSPPPCPTCHIGCFISGTKVFTKSGFKKIEDLTTGNEVLSYNSKTKQAEYKPVGKTWEFESKEVYEIIIDKGSSINVTSEHPFYTMRGKIRAGKLEAGDTLIAVSSDTVKIAEIRIHSYDRSVKTYNLTMEDTHTFFVGEEGVLVGNYSNAADVTPRTAKR